MQSGSCRVELYGVPATHVPHLHVPPVQGVPSVTQELEHPSVGSQMSEVHSLPSPQSAGEPATQAPVSGSHPSRPLHTFASSQVRSSEQVPEEMQEPSVHEPSMWFESTHAVPSVTATFVQPVVGSQASAVQSLVS